MTSTREQLLTEFDELDRAIDNASVNPTWALADWLAANVPNNGDGRPPKTAPVGAVSLQDLADRTRADDDCLNEIDVEIARRVSVLTLPMDGVIG